MEIILPSQVLPYVDAENPIAIELMSNGVGIFFTEDNLTTVINIVDGENGISTDVTSNEKGVQSGDYRVGVDTSSLDATSQTSISENPYQLFKTAETVQDEYGLVFDSNGYVELSSPIPQISNGSVGGVYSVEIDITWKYKAGENNRLFGNGSGFIRIYDTSVDDYFFATLITPFDLSGRDGDYLDIKIVAQWLDDSDLSAINRFFSERD